ncbi:hypothetical protein A8O28_16935 [Enterobacteriaceae bacterium CCUG 67584]|jgi:hypothetical protein|nr:hypothetical protein [Enterobacteriaceae bacterium CCUG 67584]
MAFEVDYLMRLDESGVITCSGDDAVANDVGEWLDTPRGHIYGRPEWGNLLALFKHQPPNEDTSVALENSILLGMQTDLTHLLVSGIRCIPDSSEPDLYRVQIMTQEGYVDAVYRV